MKVEVKVPQMGESVSTAIISQILSPSGSYVESGQEILELETDKVNQVLYALDSGEISLSASIGQEVHVGDVIGWIETSAEKKATSPPSPQKAPKEKPVPTNEPIDSPTATTRQKMTSLRKTIAARLVEAKNHTAMLTTFNEADMSAIMEIRAKEQEKFQQKHGIKLGFMSFFVKAVVSALKAYPIINSYIDEDEIVTFTSQDISIAVSTDRGLVTPVVRNCEALSIPKIEQQIASYASKAREGKLSIEDLKGGGFTITNGGVFGSMLSTPLLNLPQSAILGMHAIIKRPIVIEDEVKIRPMMYLALSYDHRLIDGKEAVLFLVHVKECLENPGQFSLEL